MTLRIWQLDTPLCYHTCIRRYLPLSGLLKTCSNQSPCLLSSDYSQHGSQSDSVKTCPPKGKSHFLTRSKCRRPDCELQGLRWCAAFYHYHPDSAFCSSSLPSLSFSQTSPPSHRTFLLVIYSPLNAFPSHVCMSSSLTTFKKLLTWYLSYIHCLFYKHTWMLNNTNTFGCMSNITCLTQGLLYLIENFTLYPLLFHFHVSFILAGIYHYLPYCIYFSTLHLIYFLFPYIEYKFLEGRYFYLLSSLL